MDGERDAFGQLALYLALPPSLQQAQQGGEIGCVLTPHGRCVGRFLRVNPDLAFDGENVHDLRLGSADRRSLAACSFSGSYVYTCHP